MKGVGVVWMIWIKEESYFGGRGFAGLEDTEPSCIGLMKHRRHVESYIVGCE